MTLALYRMFLMMLVFERLINTHSGESCRSSTHAKSDDGAELPTALSLEDHVAGERMINTTLRRSMARSRESVCGRSAELSALLLSTVGSCSSSVDSTDSSDLCLS